MKKILFGLLALVIVLVSSPVLAQTIPDHPVGQKRYIVKFEPQTSAASQEKKLKNLSAKRLKQLELVNAQVANLTDAQVSKLRQDPQVLRVEEDAQAFALCHKPRPWCPSPTPTPTPPASPVPSPSPSANPTPSPSPAPTPSPTPTPTPSPSPSPTPSTQPIPWGIDRIDAEKVWTTTSADSVKVAVIDTGIDMDHPDLVANVKGGINTITGGSPDDDNGHGSHVAGIIAAVNNSIGVVGVGNQIDLYSVKVLNSAGSGYTSDIIEGIQWAIANNIKVINMSLGTQSDIQSFHDAVIAAKNAGITIVAAAGNSGPYDNTVIYPAKYQESIAVSATNSADSQPTWSSRGPEVDLAAPGSSIYSTYRNATYSTLSGTSMASPHAAGAAALVIATHPGFTPDQVKSKLQLTADNLPLLSTNQEGAGLVDAEEAALTP